MHLIDADNLRGVEITQEEMDYLMTYIDEDEDIDHFGDIVVDEDGYEDLRRLLAKRGNTNGD